MIPVILSGGSGTRLWPVSRASYPKQFCEFYDRSFLRNSMDRLKSFGKPHILTVESMRNLTLKTLLDSGYDRSQAIYEPFGKNTGPAVGLLCHWMVLNGHEQEVVGVFPADHLVTREDQFQKAVSLAVECAEQGELVTLGIQPTYPATGYGYIEVTQEVFKEGAEHTAFVVQGFREKPDEALASEFVDSGHYFWNAGMFVFKVSRMVELFKEYLPDMWRRIETIKKDLSNLKHVYANLESVSLDYGLMEKLQRQICIPCEIGWSDVGSWDEISRISEDQNKMVTDSKAINFSYEADSNYVYAVKEKVVSLIGVHDLIVVDTPDALLVTRKGESQKVREVVQEIRQRGLVQATEHPFEIRPWGGFEVLLDSPSHKVKTIHVEPDSQLSYQSHEKRSEHWVVVRGEAEVTLNGEVKVVHCGESIYIPKGTKHRIRNPKSEMLVFIEVQTGEYFGEDDVVRYDDDYDRC